ncbi:MAG: trypsin-like peptidase domain-containing protein [Verrucomicrobia bacterium]|nr:trypsin-like peptidase domain-containing protein [Verrucomicrobiota bacterium]
MHRRFRFLALVLTVIFPLRLLAAADPEKSVVQIFASSQQPSWSAPWRFNSVQRGSGSGFVIKGKRIMTNAHVVAWARQILLKRFQDPRPYLARVVFIGHDCDLAVLEPEDAAFFDGLEPLEIGELAKVRSTVVTYGYPAGGEQISYTRGVVSRIEIQTYVHSGNRSFLAVQTDAAINPGNSGGPVIQDGRVAGVAFQNVPGLENAGFFIPPQVIHHFLKDVEDGRYDSFPLAGIRVVPLQNPAYRKKLKLAGTQTGARIDSLVPIPSTTNLLRADDVLLQIGPHAVGSDGTILFDGNRVNLAVALQQAQHGESVPLKIWRDGAELSVSLPIYAYNDDRPTGSQYDTPPRYFVYAGLVFTPLSLDYLRASGRGGGGGNDSAGSELIYDLYYRRYEQPENLRPEPIVLAAVLPNPVNANLRIQARALVDKINGVKIEKLDDVIRAFGAAKGAQHVIEFLPKGVFECLDRAEADKASAEIMETYGVDKDRRL